MILPLAADGGARVEVAAAADDRAGAGAIGGLGAATCSAGMRVQAGQLGLPTAMSSPTRPPCR
jgi:hypothetical protein